MNFQEIIFHLNEYWANRGSVVVQPYDLETGAGTFNPATTLRFGLHRPGDVRLEIFDVEGRLVSRLVDTYMPAGEHRARWTGHNDQGGQAV